jgi:hypothetical protein
MISRIQLFRVEMLSDKWDDIEPGTGFQAVRVNDKHFMAFEDGRHFFIDAADVEVVRQLYPVPTAMGAVEEHLDKVKA